MLNIIDRPPLLSDASVLGLVFCMCLVFASVACSLPTMQSLDQQSQDDDTLKKLASAGKGMVQCRLCKGDHWTTHCPYKESLEPGTASEGATGQCGWE